MKGLKRDEKKRKKEKERRPKKEKLRTLFLSRKKVESKSEVEGPAAKVEAGWVKGSRRQPMCDQKCLYDKI